jgi:cell division protein FtsQ
MVMPATLLKNRHPLRNSYTPVRRSVPGAGRKASARSGFSGTLFPAFGSLRGTLIQAGVFAAALLVLLGFSIGLTRIYHYCTTSEFFEISRIEMTGLQQLTERDVLEISGLREGDNSLRIHIPEMEQKILKNPWVESVSIRRELPDRFVIHITERTPSFWVLHEGTLHYIDSSGRIIAPVEANNFRSLPTLDIGPGGEEAIKHISAFMEKLNHENIPFDPSQISWLRISAGKGFELYWETRQLSMSIAIEDWQDNLHRLGLAIRDIEKRNELSLTREILAASGQVWLQKS